MVGVSMDRSLGVAYFDAGMVGGISAGYSFYCWKCWDQYYRIQSMQTACTMGVGRWPATPSDVRSTAKQYLSFT
jgi:hypothetical protein